MIKTLNNMDVVITGTLAKMTRARAFEAIRMEGGRPHKKITGNTDVLVCAIPPHWVTEKVAFAEQKKINTITEKEFYFLIGVK